MARMVITVAALLLSTSVFAASIEAPGKVFYKMSDGQIVWRDAVLTVPARGEGDVVLKSGGVDTTAHAFTTRTLNSRTIFYVVFLDSPGAPEGTATVFKGTYSRGTNVALYYADFFSKPVTSSAIGGSLIPEESPESDWTYEGGFWFKAPVVEEAR